MTDTFHKKHHLGQNFLVNQGVITQSLRRASISSQDVVLEIGPGQGALTTHLLQASPKHLHLVEFDRSLEPWLDPLVSATCSLHWSDALQFDFRSLDPTPTKVVANIPYHITTPLIWRLYAHLAPLGLSQLVLLVQKEAAQRLCAPACSKQRYPGTDASHHYERTHVDALENTTKLIYAYATEVLA